MHLLLQVIPLISFLVASSTAQQDFSILSSSRAEPLRTLAKRATRPNGKSLLCYYDSQSIQRPEKGSLKVEKIDPSLCTHIIFRFVRFSNESQDGTHFELDDVSNVNLLRRLVSLKRINPDLKILIAINDDSSLFSKMVSDLETRSQFITSVLRYLDRNGVDGVEIVWRYPNDARGQQTDKQNLVELLHETRNAFEPRGLLLAAAVPVGDRRVRSGFDVVEVSKYLDFINLMSYDYNGGWDTETGLHAPLYPAQNFDLSHGEETLNVNWSVNYWLSLGAPAEKLMLGVTTYGRSFNLLDSNIHGLRAATNGPAEEGPYTRDTKLLAYNEICQFFQDQPDFWTLVRDPNHQSPYSFNGLRWISYEDMDSAATKGRYINSVGLGGAVINSLDLDDFSGRCHSEKYPVINALKRAMFEAVKEEPERPVEPVIVSPPSPSPPPTEVPFNDNQQQSTRPPQTTTSSFPFPTPPDVPIPDRFSNGPPAFLNRPSARPSQPSPPPRPPRPINQSNPSPPPPPLPVINRPPPNPAPVSPPQRPVQSTRAPPREVTTPKPNSSSRQRLPVCGTNGMWYFPGPTCREYYDCTGGSAVLMLCRDNLIWKQSRLWCDFPENVPECRI